MFPAIKSFFEEFTLPRSVNSAALALVPKMQGASTLPHYRPISCCNVLYKVITKILTNRMKDFMPTLVSNTQAAFVKGRKIGDHVLLAQALVKDYHISRGAPRIAFKLDISKAFDTLSWDYLFALLLLQGFHPTFIQWLRICITGSMISVKVNGSLEGYFRCCSGLKQGDPLSPYLFVLAMEGFTACINRATSSPDFKFHSNTKEAGVSHLIFADDVLLFCNGDDDSVRILLDAVGQFSAMSGLHLNPSKCFSFFGNVPSATQDFAIAVSRFNRGTLPVSYLGLPLISGRLCNRDCQPLISKLCGRFEVWSNKFISQAGRAQLITAVIYGLQAHWSLYLFLPKKILNRIQGIMAKFLWKGSVEGSCFYKVAWHQCCLRKNEGGLGFKELLSWNKAAVMFQVWRIITNCDDSLWLKWFYSCWLKNRAFWTTHIPQKSSWAMLGINNF